MKIHTYSHNCHHHLRQTKPTQKNKANAKDATKAYTNRRSLSSMAPSAEAIIDHTTPGPATTRCAIARHSIARQAKPEHGTAKPRHCTPRHTKLSYNHARLYRLCIHMLDFYATDMTNNAADKQQSCCLMRCRCLQRATRLPMNITATLNEQ